MENNVFLRDSKKLKLADYMRAQENGRENLGSELPVAVYRLLEYSLREELEERFGKEEQISIFRNAGYKAGVYFAQKYLDSSLEHSFRSVWRNLRLAYSGLKNSMRIQGGRFLRYPRMRTARDFLF